MVVRVEAGTAGGRRAGKIEAVFQGYRNPVQWRSGSSVREGALQRLRLLKELVFIEMKIGVARCVAVGLSCCYGCDLNRSRCAGGERVEEVG